jgi:hypothetical protein
LWIQLYCRYWAVKMTVESVCRYLLGTLERLKMGMTVRDASERSFRWEIKRIEDVKSRIRDAVFLNRRKRQYELGML